MEEFITDNCALFLCHLQHQLRPPTLKPTMEENRIYIGIDELWEIQFRDEIMIVCYQLYLYQLGGQQPTDGQWTRADNVCNVWVRPLPIGFFVVRTLPPVKCSLQAWMENN